MPSISEIGQLIFFVKEQNLRGCSCKNQADPMKCMAHGKFYPIEN